MVNANTKTVMEVWQEIRKNKECGAERLVAEYGNRLYAATVLLCANDHDAEELVFRTFDQAVKKKPDTALCPGRQQPTTRTPRPAINALILSEVSGRSLVKLQLGK